MGYFEFIVALIGTGGISFFVYEFYTMKVKKKSLEAELVSKYADEWQKLYNEMKNYTDKKVSELERKITQLEKRDEFRNLAIEQYRHCEHLPKGGECPVIKMVETINTPVTMATINENNIESNEKGDE